MAERPQGFARRMMAQRLMSDARDDPFSDSRFFSGRIRPSMEDMTEPTRFSDMAMPAYATGATASLFAPGAGVTDIMGFAPDPAQPGEFLPSFGQNITQGNYLDAGLQALGGAGDVMMAGGTIIPPLAVIGTTLKAPRAARVAGQAVDAAKNVDEARAALEASPNDPVLKQQYLDLRRQRDAQLSQMSASEQLELDVSYRMDHQPRGPQDGGGRLDDITSGGELFPEDVYSADGLRIYGNPNNASDRQSYAAIMAARGNPDAEITIYRAVPQDVDQINPGDWVTLSPEYASVHAASGYGSDGQQAGKVISQRVRVKDVYSDGNDLNEFGFFPSELADAGVKKIVPPTETEPGIIAFHGSGADFDEFRLEMIGTGEGAQAYGYGLYFTDSEDIAKFYRNSVGGANVLKTAQNIKIEVPSGGTETAANFTGFRNKFAEFYGEDAALFADRYLGQFTIDPDAPQDVLIERAKVLMANVKESDRIPENAEEIVSKITLPERGKIYKVGLSPKPDELLDFDASFSEQSKDVQEKLIKAGYELDPRTSGSGNMIIESIMSDIAKARLAGRDETLKNINARLSELAKEMDKYSSGYRNFNDPRGQVLADEYDALLVERENLPTMTMSEARKLASQELAKAGIPGIKYRAAGSRGASTSDEAAERNYVIFDDRAVKILEKYGIAGPVLVTGGAVAATQRGGDEEGSIFPDA